MTDICRFKIGQMLMAGFPSAEVDGQARRLVEDFMTGNFVLFARNFGSAEQTIKLCSGLHKLVYDKTGLSPLIAADQEGGVVCRLTEGAALIPGQMAVAAACTDATAVGENCAAALSSVGVNTDLAPVLDVNRDPMNPIIGARAFSDSAGTVGRLGLEMLDGLRAGDVLAAVKHFPGHGNVQTDSHLGIPRSGVSLGDFTEIDLVPFRSAFAHGADALMTCHVAFDCLDPGRPATLSRRIMTDLLRGELGFKGIAITDCLEMGAVSSACGVGEGAVLAVEAGCDILCFSHTYEAVSLAAQALYAAVDSGRITPERIDESYERILRIKTKYHLLEPPSLSAESARSVIYDPARIERNRKISRRSVTLISDGGGLELLRQARRPAFFAPASLALTGNEDREKRPAYFSRLAQERFGGSSAVLPIDGLDEASRAAICAPDYDAAVLGLYNARFRPGQQQALRLLEEQNRPLVVVLLGAPYDAALIRRADAVIAAYEYTPLSVDSVLDALESSSFSGRLPVAL